MAPANPPQAEVDALNSVVDNSVAVVKNLKGFVHNIYADAVGHCAVQQPPKDKEASSSSNPKPAASWNPPTPLDALALAHDSATLIRAHSTKLSLLIINEPFTPSAISRVVQEVVHGPVPALAKAVEVCYGDRYTYCMQRDVATRSESLLGQLQQLLESIPRDGRVLSTSDKGKKTAGSSSRSSAGGGGGGASGSSSSSNNFTNIGILWKECDGLMALAKLGVRGRLIQIVEQLSATIKDTLEELKEWSEEEDDDDDDDDEEETAGEADLEDGNDNKQGGGGHPYADAQAAVDAFMDSSSRHIPADDPDALRPRLDMSLKKMRLVGLLFSAIIKRRLRTLPPILPTARPTDTAARLDGAVAALKVLPDKFDDLAMAFYGLNRADVDKLMESSFGDACAVAELLSRPWEVKEGGEDKGDEFSAWVRKFQIEIQTKLLAGKGT